MMKEGVTLWTFDQRENREARNDIMNVYTALYVTDLDDDGVADIVTMHGGDPIAKPGLAQIENYSQFIGQLIVDLYWCYSKN